MSVAHPTGNQELGRLGEQLTAELLLSQGYKILGRNISGKLGEIDILAEYESTIVIVEVKSQLRKGSIDPIYRLNPRKRAKLRQLASVIFAKYSDRFIRIDAVTVYWNGGKPELTHYENI